MVRIDSDIVMRTVVHDIFLGCFTGTAMSVAKLNRARIE